MAHCAFDSGICHFDLANNYGPEYGTAEENFGHLMEASFRPYRDELFISSKAGWDMWPGPYGNWGSRKYLMASLDQSLRRMKLDYVDIFYSHRWDPETPIEETMQALVDIVRQGKALYVGLSRYPADKAREAYRYLAEHDVPCLLYQDRYNIIDRAPQCSGKTYLLYEGDPADNNLAYRIPEDLDGEYSVYSFQQNFGCPQTSFVIESGDRTETVTFDRADLLVEGQTRGEWVKLGDFTFAEGNGGRIRITSEEPGIHADGILFVKK